jgi:hypothetical protein
VREKVLISVDPSDLKRIDAAAAARGMPRSTFLVFAGLVLESGSSEAVELRRRVDQAIAMLNGTEPPTPRRPADGS